MWYFAWILGVLLACSMGIINGLWLEQIETNELAENQQNTKNGETDENDKTT